MNLLFSSEQMKINNQEQPVCNFNDQEKYIVQIRKLKQALHHGRKLAKFIIIMYY